MTALLAVACTPMPQRAHVAAEWLPSPNRDERRPSFVVLHHTGSSDVRHALRTLTAPQREVSAHYVIARDGAIWQLVDERARAWHAGAAYWAGVIDINSASIGIELDNDGREAFAEAQVDALIGLLRDVVGRYRIAPWNILGHGDVAPGRKVDPGAAFPWRRLAQAGFGLWCDAPEAADAASVTAPASPMLLLQALGYDVRDASAAIAAYRRHYRADDSERLDGEDVPLLACLVRLKAQRGSVSPD